MSKSPTRDTIQVKRDRFLVWSISILVPVFLFTPMALVQFLCLFFLFILIGSRVYSEYLARNIKVSRMDAELRVFRHEWVRVELKVENHGLLPAYMLVVGDLPGNLQVFNMRKTFCTLYRRSWTLLYWDGLCSDRGVFSVGPAVIRGADPLGLFPFSLTTKETSRLFVYPCVRGINLKIKKASPLETCSVQTRYSKILRAADRCAHTIPAMKRAVSTGR